MRGDRKSDGHDEANSSQFWKFWETHLKNGSKNVACWWVMCTGCMSPRVGDKLHAVVNTVINFRVS